MAAKRASVSRLLNPASTRMHVLSVRMKVQFPELLLARIQILTIWVSGLDATQRKSLARVFRYPKEATASCVA